MPQLSAGTLSTCLNICSSLLLACLAKYHGTYSWHSSHWWDFWDPLAASLQPRPFLCPLSLCPGSGWSAVSSTTVLQHPAALYGHEYPLVRYIMNSQIKMHKMMQHRWEIMREGQCRQWGQEPRQPSWCEQPCFCIRAGIPP